MATSVSAPPRPTWLVPVALGTVYVGWGATYLGIRLMVQSIPPFLGAGTRFVFAGVLVLAWIAWRRGPAAVRVTRGQLAALAVVGTLLLASGNGVVTLGERHVTAGLASLLFASIPLWMVLLRVLLGERPRPLALGGVLLGFGGVAILLLPGERPGGATTIGLVTILAAAVSWSAGSVISGRLAGQPDAFTATGWQMVLGGLVLLVLAGATGEMGSWHAGATTLKSIGGWAFLVGPGSILTFSAYVWLLRNARLGLVGTYAFVNPVVAVTLGALLLGEPVTGAVAVGALVIVAAVAVVVSSDR